MVWIGSLVPKEYGMVKNEVSDIVCLDVYFDYLWPYVYNAAVWLQSVKEKTEQKVALNWRYFSLEQVNNKKGSQWKIWEKIGDYPNRELRAFWAAEAARCQGEAAFDSFHMALLRARHE